jgi:hypothetical protein
VNLTKNPCDLVLILGDELREPSLVPLDVEWQLDPEAHEHGLRRGVKLLKRAAILEAFEQHLGFVERLVPGATVDVALLLEVELASRAGASGSTHGSCLSVGFPKPHLVTVATRPAFAAAHTSGSVNTAVVSIQRLKIACLAAP